MQTLRKTHGFMRMIMQTPRKTHGFMNMIMQTPRKTHGFMSIINETPRKTHGFMSMDPMFWTLFGPLFDPQKWPKDRYFFGVFCRSLLDSLIYQRPAV